MTFLLICHQCGQSNDRDLEFVSNRLTGESWWLHEGGCEPDSYDRWEPTRRIER